MSRLFCPHKQLSIIILISGLCIVRCTGVYYPTTIQGSQKALEFSDRVYEKTIRSVQLYPTGNIPYSKYQTPVIPLRGGSQLRLEFDDLKEDNEYYLLRIKYLTSDWKESYVNSIEFLEDYNEYRINDYELSLDTKVKYVHYSIDIPPVKIAGNYLAIVYREGDEDDIILSRRFIVFNEDVTVTGPDELSGFTSFGGHRIDFNIFYNDLDVEDPYNQLRATIRQNGRWDNSKHLLTPTFVKEDLSKLEFRYFDNSNSFPPGNEFRYFDIRSIISPGQFVQGINRQASPVSVNVQTDKPRTGLAYTFYRDLNGGFQSVNFDAQNSTYYSDYLKVNFELEMDPYDSTREIYVFGALTDWQLKPEARMNFDKESRTYRTAILLKQGWYDYMYYQAAPGNDKNIIEGDYIDTENFYEVFVYFKPIGRREEYCVGYFQFGVNERIR